MFPKYSRLLKANNTQKLKTPTTMKTVVPKGEKPKRVEPEWGSRYGAYCSKDEAALSLKQVEDGRWKKDVQSPGNHRTNWRFILLKNGKMWRAIVQKRRNETTFTVALDNLNGTKELYRGEAAEEGAADEEVNM